MKVRGRAVAAIVAMAALFLVAVGGPAEAASGGLGKPTSTGSLRIGGTLRDGAVVSARGLTWHPIALPHGDKMLSFGVTRSWRACSKATGKCVPAADQTSTPLAAKRYVVGHADTGRRLRLTETATEVVETDPANFGFKVIRSSATVTTAATVKPFVAGRAPTSNFINGMPEQRTGSNQEDVPGRARPLCGQATASPRSTYRVDSAPWTAAAGQAACLPPASCALGHHLVPGAHLQPRRHHAASRSAGGSSPLPQPAGVHAQRRLLVSAAPR